MDKKTYNLWATITTAIGSVAAAIVAYLNPGHETAIVASISAAEGCILTILGNFVIEEGKKNGK